MEIHAENHELLMLVVWVMREKEGRGNGDTSTPRESDQQLHSLSRSLLLTTTATSHQPQPPKNTILRPTIETPTSNLTISHLVLADWSISSSLTH